MENEKQFQCTGDCLKCIAVQRQYCASQHAYNSMVMIRKMQESLDVLSDEIFDLRKKVSAIQDNEALLFNPSEEKAQEGAGAKE